MISLQDIFRRNGRNFPFWARGKCCDAPNSVCVPHKFIAQTPNTEFLDQFGSCYPSYDATWTEVIPPQTQVTLPPLVPIQNEQKAVSCGETYVSATTACECGSEKLGSPAHSHWCPKFQE